MKKLLVSLVIVPVLLLSGCNAYQTAQRFETVLAGIISIAQAEEGALPPADAAIVKQWTDLGVTLDSQLNACIMVAGQHGGKGATFAGCFNTFASGLASPAELAQLRVLSPGAQKKAQLYVTAAILGVNAALTAFKVAEQPVPQIGSAPQPSAQEINQLRVELGY